MQLMPFDGQYSVVVEIVTGIVWLLCNYIGFVDSIYVLIRRRCTVIIPNTSTCGLEHIRWCCSRDGLFLAGNTHTRGKASCGQNMLLMLILGLQWSQVHPPSTKYPNSDLLCTSTELFLMMIIFHLSNITK